MLYADIKYLPHYLYINSNNNKEKNTNGWQKKKGAKGMAKQNI